MNMIQLELTTPNQVNQFSLSIPIDLFVVRPTHSGQIGTIVGLI